MGAKDRARARRLLGQLLLDAAERDYYRQLLGEWIALEERHAATEADVDALIRESRRALGE